MSAHAMAAAGTRRSQDLWLVSRASGLVLLVLFTAVVVLGVSTWKGTSSRRWPRFAVAELHRTLSLFAVALLGLHVATALLDPYVSISWLASVLPFTSHYETLAIGLGTLAVDIAGAVLITSLLRVRLGLRVWRAVHYLAYLAWPLAFVHSITAAGYDQHSSWVVGIEWGSLTAVVVAVAFRLLGGRQASEPSSATARRPVEAQRAGHGR